jgi:hypothetical protein
MEEKAKPIIYVQRWTPKETKQSNPAYRKRFGSRPKRFRRTAQIMLGPVYAGK